ncbi:MAG: homoserine dehydrogenase [Tahibacter sp.]
MSAVAVVEGLRHARLTNASAYTKAGAASQALAVALVGTGLVGGALLQQLSRANSASLRLLLIGAANSRNSVVDSAGIAADQILPRLGNAGTSDLDALVRGLESCDARCRVVIDATPSEDVALRHAHWLARGIHVVSANKIAQGTSLLRWQDLQHAATLGQSRYGAAATVGAGLPILASLRRLTHAGDHVHALEGVFSGSLSFLFNRYDGTRAFSTLLDEARALGYTEPDPRADLSGADVARKLLILARTAGLALEESAVLVEGLVSPQLAALPTHEFFQRIAEVDEAIEHRYRAATREGKVLRYLAQLDDSGKASVGLRAVSPDHPAATLAGADNLFALTTTHYRERPLVIIGPGAGAAVTAQALLADALEIAAIT